MWDCGHFSQKYTTTKQFGNLKVSLVLLFPKMCLQLKQFPEHLYFLQEGKVDKKNSSDFNVSECEVVLRQGERVFTRVEY